MVPPARGFRAPSCRPPRKGRLSGLTAGPFPGTGETAGTDQKAPQGLGGRLGGLIGRGRNGADVPDKPRTNQHRKHARYRGTGRLTALGAALRAEPAQPAPQEATQADAPGAFWPPPTPPPTAMTRTSRAGFSGAHPMSRRVAPTRTGLLLTIILLILLAAIAVWSALFLPNSPVARLLGGGEEVAAEDPLDAPDATDRDHRAPRPSGNWPPSRHRPDRFSTKPGHTADAPAADPAAEADVVLRGRGRPRTASTSPRHPRQSPNRQPHRPPNKTPRPPQPTWPTWPTWPRSRPCRPCRSMRCQSLEDTEAAYAEYGIWQRPPDRPDLAPIDSLSDLGLSAVDRDVAALDAHFAALAAPRPVPKRLRRIPSPPPFGTSPARTAAGLVAATPEGVITPDGVLVTGGHAAGSGDPAPAQRRCCRPGRRPSASRTRSSARFRPGNRARGDLGLAAPQEAQPGQPPITPRQPLAAAAGIALIAFRALDRGTGPRPPRSSRSKDARRSDGQRGQPQRLGPLPRARSASRRHGRHHRQRGPARAAGGRPR